jgi:hypothetical protein
MADGKKDDGDESELTLDLGSPPPDELAARRAAKLPQHVPLPNVPALTQLVTKWVMQHFPEAPSDEQAAGLVGTLLEAAAMEWANFAPVDRLGSIPLTEDSFLMLATLLYRARNRFRLELRQDERGVRHYVEGRPLNAGDLLQVRLNDKSWATGRYEWSFREGDPPKLSTGSVTYVLRAGASVRWPQ